MPSAGSTSPVLTEVQGATLVITLNRPVALNAIDRATSAALHGAFDRLADDDALRVGVLTGAGKAFCAGSDLIEIRDRPAFADGLAAGNVTSLTRRVLTKPVVAAVNGLAYGGGAELVLACDIAIAAPAASFALPEVRHGLVAAAGGLVRGPRQLPLKVVADLLLTGEPISAERALQLGLVSRLADDVVAEAVAMAERIASYPAAAVAVVRSSLPRALDAPLLGGRSAWEVVEPDVMGVLRQSDVI